MDLVYYLIIPWLDLNFVLPLVTHERDSLRKGIQYGISVSFCKSNNVNGV